MKKRLKSINAADDMQSRLAELLPIIDDDYEYLISGLEKLDRSGKDLSDKGYEIAQNLYEYVQQLISDVSEIF